MIQSLMDNANSVMKMTYPEVEEFRIDLNFNQTSSSKKNVTRFIQTAGIVTALLAPIENQAHPYISYSNQHQGFGIHFSSGRLETGEQLTKQNNDVVNGYDYSYTVTIPNYNVVSIDTRQEAIEVNNQRPSLFTYEKNIKSKVVNAGFFEPTLDTEFEETIWDELEDAGQLFKFEKKLKSKVVYGGNFEFPPLD